MTRRCPAAMRWWGTRLPVSTTACGRRLSLRCARAPNGAVFAGIDGGRCYDNVAKLRRRLSQGEVGPSEYGCLSSRSSDAEIQAVLFASRETVSTTPCKRHFSPGCVRVSV